MLKRKQIVVIGSVVVLMGLLLSLDIKGLVKEEGQHSTGAAKNAAAVNSVNLSVESVSETAKQSLNASLAEEISQLETGLKSAEGGEKLKIQKELIQKWDDVNQPAPAGLYAEMVANTEPSYSAWLKAGDFFTNAYQNTQDTLTQPALVEKAIHAYDQALQANPKSLDAKTGLGVAYVNGAGSPMQGIQLLLGVVKEDPKNVKANLNLGLFSMKSGQFDKAVNRFRTVVEQTPSSPEAWFYLASAYENLGQNSDAVTAYEKSKELAVNPNLTKFVDKKIKELSK